LFILAIEPPKSNAGSLEFVAKRFDDICGCIGGVLDLNAADEAPAICYKKNYLNRIFKNMQLSPTLA
jgi:hypothetical protein